MSRIGKKPVPLPKGVKAALNANAAMSAPKRMEVSRKAATEAIGARVIAQSARLYDAIEQKPPARPRGHL